MTNNIECLCKSLGFYLKHYPKKVWETAIDTLGNDFYILKEWKNALKCHLSFPANCHSASLQSSGYDEGQNNETDFEISREIISILFFFVYVKPLKVIDITLSLFRKN